MLTGSLAQSSAEAHTGTHSLGITSTTGGFATTNASLGEDFGGPGLLTNVVAGSSYQFAGWVFGAVGANNTIWEQGTDWYQASGAYISSSGYSSAQFSDTNTTWTYFAYTWSAPATAANCILRLNFSAQNSGETHFLDTVSIRQVGVVPSPSRFTAVSRAATV